MHLSVDRQAEFLLQLGGERYLLRLEQLLRFALCLGSGGGGAHSSAGGCD